MSIIPQDKDIVIIGAGFAGLTLAVALLRQKHRVRIISDDSDPLAASAAAHGISTVKGILESDEPTFGLKLEGHRGFDEWLTGVEAIVGAQRPSHVWKTGATEKFHDLVLFKKEFGRIYRRDFVGAKKVILNDSDPNSFMCASYPGDWWVDPAYVLKVLKKASQTLGGKIITERISSIKYKNQQFQLISPSGLHLCQVLVLAAGVGTKQLMSSLGSDAPNLYAVAGHTFKTKEPTNTLQNAPPIVVKGTLGFAVSASKAYWGSTSEQPHAIKDCGNHVQPDQPRPDVIAKQLWTTLLPEITTPLATDTVVRWGVRVRTRDRKPLYGRVIMPTHPDAQLWLNTAYYKSGIILSWLIAQKLKNLISES